MKHSVKHWLSLLLCAVLLLSVGPVKAAAETDPAKILTEAYALEKGASLSYSATLTGKITSIKTPYDSYYKNVSVIIEVPGYADKPMLCYRLAGEGADALLVDDTITVTGTITNYNGTIEFMQGCTLDYVEPDCCIPVPPRDKEIVDQAYLLEPGAMLPYTATLTGKIVSVDIPYSEAYKNITVTIAVEGKEDKPIVCFRLQGEGTKDLKVGDTVTVIGVLYHYQKLDETTGEVITDQIEFKPGCTLDGVYPPDKEENIIAAGTVTFENWEDAAWGFGAQFIPGEDGTVTVTVSHCDPGYYLDIYADGEWVEEYLDSTPGTVTVNVTKGVTYDIDLTTVEITLDPPDISVWDYAPGSLDFSITADVPHGEPNPEVPGSGMTVEVITPDDWQECYVYAWNPELFGCWPGTQLTADVDGSYRFELTEAVGGMVINGGYNVSGDFQMTDDITDLTFTAGASATVTIGEMNDIGKYPYTLEIDGSTVGGSQPDLEGLYSMAIVGSNLPGISDWDPADPVGDMTQIDPGIFMKELEFDSACQVWFKFVGNDYWNDQWTFGGNCTVEFDTNIPLEQYPASADLTLEVPGPCTLEFYLDLSNGPDVPLLTVMASPLPIPGPVENTYRVVGNAPWMGNWDPASDQGLMEQVEPGVYRKTFEAVTAGTYEFRITLNGRWDQSWGCEDGNNYRVTLPRTADLTVTFTSEDGKVSVFYDAGLPGDINGDSKLNVADVSKLYAHIRGTGTLAPELLDLADLSGDGKLNIADVSKLYAYVRGVSPEAIVDKAYQLAEGEALPGPVTLTGAVLSILEPYQPRYNGLTLVMEVPGREDKPIICTRLTGEDAACVAVTDVITVTGTLQNYYGTVEFAEGCRLDKWEHTPTPEEAQAAAVDAAYALAENTSMDHPETLTGQVISVDQAYSSSLPYISITIAVPGKEDKPIGCYRLVGEQIPWITEGDTVTVTGTLRNYYGTVEFAAGCQLESYSPGAAMGTDPLRIVDAAYALAPGAALPYSATLTGKITSIDTEWSDLYKNITVTIVVAGREDKPIVCYRLKGDGAKTLAVSDTITVNGVLKNYQYSTGECRIEFDAGCKLLSVIK